MRRGRRRALPRVKEAQIQAGAARRSWRRALPRRRAVTCATRVGRGRARAPGGRACSGPPFTGRRRRGWRHPAHALPGRPTHPGLPGGRGKPHGKESPPRAARQGAGAGLANRARLSRPSPGGLGVDDRGNLPRSAQRAPFSGGVALHGRSRLAWLRQARLPRARASAVASGWRSSTARSPACQRRRARWPDGS